VHGFACAGEDWRAQLAALRERYDAIAPDLPRAGEATIARLGREVARHLGEPAILIGHSMGCRVVLEAARLIADKVAGIVLVDGSRNATRDPQGAEAAAAATVDKLGYAPFAEMLFRQMFFRPSAEADAIVARAVKSSAEFGPALWPRITRWDAGQMDAAFDSLRAPVLAIQSTTRNAELKRAPLKRGDSSPWIDYLRSRRARVEIVPDTGHFTQLEAPETVNRLIADFLEAV